MALQRVYCSKDIFEDIILSEGEPNEYGILFTILNDFSDVILDMNDEEFEKEIMEDGVYKSFLKRESSRFIAYPDFFTNFDQEDNYDNYATDIILIDKPSEFTTRIRDHKGVLTLNSEEFIKIKDFNRPLGFRFSFNGSDSFLSWKELFNAKNICPVNSAVIVDNFLFKNYNEYKTENLFEILISIIPKSLDVPFHLTIISLNKDAFINSTRANEIIEELKTKVEIELEVAIQIGMIVHINEKILHKRMLLTNNFFIDTEHGFNVFRNKKVHAQTEGNIKWVYNSITNYIGDSTKKKHYSYLADVKYVVQETIKHPLPLNFIVGDINNRIFR